MSIWHNPTERTLRFTMRDEAYEVVPNAEVTFPDFMDWLPTSRGLPLVKGLSPVDKAPRVVPTAAPAPRQKVLPEGVTAGANAVLRDSERESDDDFDDIGEDEEPGKENAAVTKTVERLQKQGVRVPGKR